MRSNGLPIVFIVLAIGLYYVYLGPQYSEIRLFLDEKQRYDDVLAKSLELRSIRQELRNKMEGFSEADLSRLEKLVPGGVDPTKLILDLDNMASRYGIVMLDMKTELLEEAKKTEDDADTAPAEKSYQIFQLTFSFSSKYENFLSFLKDTESSLRIIDVTSITIEEDEENPQTPHFTLTISSYWLK